MSVHFAFRSPRLPAGKHAVHFDDETVLDWFAARWGWAAVEDEEALERRVNRELGCKGHGAHRLFHGEEGPPPRAAARLAELGEGAGSEVVCESPHCLQVEVGTAGAELAEAFYFFDDRYLARHGKRAAYLLHGGWRLPEAEGQGTRPGGKGRTSAVFLCAEDIAGAYRELLGGHVIAGVRLPDLARYLIETEGVDWFAEVGLLRALLPVAQKGAPAEERAFLERLRANPGDGLTWAAYSDWLQERGEPPAGLHLLRQALLRAGAEKRGVFANDYGVSAT